MATASDGNAPTPDLTAPAIPGARARARAEVRAAILAAASTQLAEVGASALSLRAVARELGMASSAVYRYFDSRDALLTALIVDAYDSLGDHVERSARASAALSPAQRWVQAAMAVRTWALAHPQDYSLLYGSPVPGYAAPDDTVVPGTRASRALIGIVRDAVASGGIDLAATGGSHVSATTRRSFGDLQTEIDLDVPAETMLAVVMTWTQLFGLLSFEMFGQTRNFVEDDEALFVDAAVTAARRLGLTETEADIDLAV